MNAQTERIWVLQSRSKEGGNWELVGALYYTDGVRAKMQTRYFNDTSFNKEYRAVAYQRVEPAESEKR